MLNLLSTLSTQPSAGAGAAGLSSLVQNGAGAATIPSQQTTGSFSNALSNINPSTLSPELLQVIQAQGGTAELSELLQNNGATASAAGLLAPQGVVQQLQTIDFSANKDLSASIDRVNDHLLSASAVANGKGVTANLGGLAGQHNPLPGNPENPSITTDTDSLGQTTSVSDASTGGPSNDHKQVANTGTQISDVANKIAAQQVKSDDIPAKKILEKIEAVIQQSRASELNPITTTPITAAPTELKEQSDNAAKLAGADKVNTLAEIAKNTGAEKVVASQANVELQTYKQQKTTGRPDSLISHENKITVGESSLGTTQSVAAPTHASDGSQLQTIIAAHNIDGKGSEAAKTENLIQQNTEAKHTPVTEQVSMRIASAAKTGETKITLQLEPHNLGKVDIKIEVSHDGRASVVVLADRHETLNTLQKDAGTLTRALQDSGLSTDSGSLSFGLREQNSGQLAREGSNAYSHADSVIGGDVEGDIAVHENGNYRIYQSDKVLDIRV